MTKKHLRLPALILLGIYALAELVLFPLAQKSGSDIVWIETFWIYILDFFYPLMGWLGLATAFGFVVYGVYRYGVRGSVPLYITIVCTMLARNVMYVISYSVLNGSLDLTSKGFILYSSLLLTDLFECVFIALTVVLAHFGIKRLREINRAKENYCKRLKKDFTPEGETLPFTKLFKAKNPILVALLLGTLSYVLSQTLYFIIKININIAVMEFYQIPLFYVTSVFAPAVACYFFARFCVKIAEWDHLRIEKLEAEEADDEEDDEDDE